MQYTDDISYLDNHPDLTAMLFALGSLTAVSIPLLIQLPISVDIVFGGFLLFRLILLFIGIRALKMWQTMLLLAGVMLLVWQQLGSLFGLEGGIAFLLMLSLLKSYEGRTRRDWQVLVLSMLFLIAGSVLFDQGLPVGLWAVFCLMLMSQTLAILNELTFRHALKHSFTAFALTLPLTAVLFIGAPRRDSPLWGVPQPQNQSSTGISEIMKPGSIGDLVQSNEPAFSATFTDGFIPKQGQLYWRVMILSEWNDGAWHMMRNYTDPALPNPATARPVSYQIITEDDKGRLPVLDYPFKHERRGFWREAGDVLRVHSRQGVRRIILQSGLSDELPHTLTDAEKTYYTQLPDQINPRTRSLSAELYRQSGGDTLRFAQLAYRYFQQQGFRYTLKPPISSDTNSTDYFLFNSKQGFCEHYADAFAFLMRASGVPTRIIGGYQGGEYHPQGGFWQVRSKDAHAWTEIWLEDKKVWKRIDPTAAASATRIENGVNSALPENEISELIGDKHHEWTQLLDRSRFYWQQWVVNYDSDRQKSLFALLGFKKVNFSSISIVLLFGFIPALIPIWLWWQRSRRQDISPMEEGFMLLKQSLLGTKREDLNAIGPMEIQQHIAGDTLPPVAQNLLEEYIRINYASTHAPIHKQARKWYKQVRKWVRRYRRTQL